MYIRFIHSGVDGYYRIKLHNSIEEKLGGVEELGADKVKKIRYILYNLDKTIDYDPNMRYYADDFPKMGKKLANQLRSLKMERRKQCINVQTAVN